MAISFAISRAVGSVARACASSMWMRRPSAASQRGSPPSADSTTDSTTWGASPRCAAIRYCRPTWSAARIALRLGRASLSHRVEEQVEHAGDVESRGKRLGELLDHAGEDVGGQVQRRARIASRHHDGARRGGRSTGGPSHLLQSLSFSSAWRRTPWRWLPVNGCSRTKSACSTTGSSSGGDPSAGKTQTTTAVGQSWRARSMKRGHVPGGCSPP